jgi:uncharacterized protein YceH (UPF0502 family)
VASTPQNFAPAVTYQPSGMTQDAASDDRIAQLEATVAELRQEVTELRRRLDDLFG